MLEEDVGCDGPVWSMSVETPEEEEVDLVLESALLAVGAGAAESSGVKAKRPWVFVEVLKDRRRFMELDWSSADKVECRCRLAP